MFPFARKCAMRNITAAIAAATTAIVVTGSIAIAAIPDSATKVITGCYSKSSGALVIIDKQAGKSCTASQIELSWAQQGVPGLPGAPGAAGLPGAPGATGPAGANATVSAGGVANCATAQVAGCELAGANQSNANLSNINLTGEDLTGRNFAGAPIVADGNP